MNKSTVHKILPWLCLLILLGTMILLQVFPDRKQQKDGTVILSGAGYREMAENDGVLYVVENSGNIYSMDWETGEKVHLYSAPDNVEWESDPSISCLYYIVAGTLCRTHIPSAEEEMLWDIKAVAEILAVTENYVLYLHWTQDPERPYDIWCVDTTTMEPYCILPAEALLGNENPLMEQYAVAGEGDVAYVLFRNPSIVEDPNKSRYWLEAWDLSTGQRTFLTETGKHAFFLAAGSDYGGNLYYQQEDGIWRVPTDGSREGRNIWKTSEDGYFGMSALCEEGKLIIADHSIILMDLSSGETVIGAPIVCESVTDVCTDGMRYALRYWNRNNYIMLGDLPSKETKIES